MAKSTSIYIVSLYRVTLIDVCNKNSTVGILQSWDGVLDLMIEDEEVWRRIKRCRMQARTHTRHHMLEKGAVNVISPLE
jgi:hypothetical protein